MFHTARITSTIGICHRVPWFSLVNQLVLAFAVLVICAAPSSADTVTFSGTTADSGAPRWRRPSEGTPPRSLSQIGTAVPFSVQEFSVSANGDYTLQSITDEFDNFTFLCENSFNPTMPLANIRVGNDGDPSTPGSVSFTFSLVARESYFFVTTGFDNIEFGRFTNTITGPGAVTLTEPIPEPATVLLLATGLAGIAARRGKVNAQSQS